MSAERIIEIKKIQHVNPAVGMASSGTTLRDFYAVRVDGVVQDYVLRVLTPDGMVEGPTRRDLVEDSEASTKAANAQGGWLTPYNPALIVIKGYLDGQTWRLERAA